jgi:CobQ-like glutamine amidotransferase family enzyme
VSGPLRIVHLYPRELGINGDVGNVMALRKRAEWRGLSVEVVDVAPGESLPDDAHLVHIGSGPASARQPLHADIARHASQLQAWADAGVPFLGIAAGWQLLGRSVSELDGTESTGAGVLPSSARLTQTRVVGEVSGVSPLGEVAGFVNHNAATTLGGNESLATIDRGVSTGSVIGVLVDSASSGLRIGTDLHGPFLPMNPVWADHLLEAAADAASLAWGDADPRLAVQDDRARRSRDAIRARLL